MQVLGVERTGDRYTARGAGGVLWSVELHLDTRATPFRAEVVWPAAAVVAVGGGGEVHFLAADSGAVVATVALGDDRFGGFGDPAGDVLYVLGWRDVIAIDRSLAVRWVSKDVAVDGILWRGQDGDRIELAAEMDPPGGWIEVELDVATGRPR